MTVDIHNFVLGEGVVVDLDSDECIRWPFRLMDNGYGVKTDRALAPPKRVWLAHRWVWTKVHGPIPDGMTLDHVRARGCTFRDCVSLRHLELVTQAENNARALEVKAPKAVCNHGHDLTLPGAKVLRGTQGRWKCRECERLWGEKFRATHPHYARDYARARREAVRANPAD